MKRKLTAFILVLVLSLSLMGSAAAAHAYSDTAELLPWAKEAVDFVSSRGLMNGVWTNRFDPEGYATRAMAATVIWRMAGSPIGNLTGVFADVPFGEWYSDAIDWAAEENFVMGERGKYRPFDPITRQDLILILYRYAGSPFSDVSILSYYNDYTQVSSYAANALAWAAETGIATGDGVNLMPKESATRAQLAAIVMRYLTITGQDPGELPVEPEEPIDPDAPVDPDAPADPETESTEDETASEENETEDKTPDLEDNPLLDSSQETSTESPEEAPDSPSSNEENHTPESVPSEL